MAAIMRIVVYDWLLELGMFICFFVSLVFGIMTLYITPTQAANYLSVRYAKNWNMPYILDIITSDYDTCPFGYDLKTFGVWSGFKPGSCFCRNQYTGIQFASDNSEQCKESKISDIFQCQDLTPSGPVYLTYFKGKNLCIKKGNGQFVSVKNSFDKKINETYPNVDFTKNYSQYINIISTTSPQINIHQQAIIDIKLLNTSQFTISQVNSTFGIDLTNYTRVRITDDYDLLFLRIGSPARPFTLFDFNKLIIDIHLYNELMCAYLDISSPLVFPETSKEYINFGGIEYCEKYDSDGKNIKQLFYHDDYKVTEPINFMFDDSITLKDFYSNGRNMPMDEYYSNEIAHGKNITLFTSNHIYGNFEPVLVYEKYLWGLGCLYFKSIEDHIAKLKSGIIMENISKGISALSILIFCLSLIFLILRIFDNCKICCIIYCLHCFLIVLLTFTNLILSFAYALIAKGAKEYLLKFRLYCQLDFTNRQSNDALKTNRMELQYYDDLHLAYYTCGFLCLVLMVNFIFLVVYFLVKCYQTNDTNSNNKELKYHEENPNQRKTGYIEQDQCEIKIEGELQHIGSSLKR